MNERSFPWPPYRSIDRSHLCVSGCWTTWRCVDCESIRGGTIFGMRAGSRPSWGDHPIRRCRRMCGASRFIRRNPARRPQQSTARYRRCVSCSPSRSIGPISDAQDKYDALFHNLRRLTRRRRRASGQNLTLGTRLSWLGYSRVWWVPSRPVSEMQRSLADRPVRLRLLSAVDQSTTFNGKIAGPES